MSDYNHSHHRDVRSGNFLTSIGGFAMIGLIAVGAILLFAEHRPHILTAFVWIAALACPLMHFFHRGHGGHGDHADHQERDDNPRNGGST